ncbi:uncharacterized protein TNCV_5066991 [Trichonephila clavipes]|nr:uncharacterized protein TNCV_5066991 [Trichonephila clavipes]
MDTFCVNAFSFRSLFSDTPVITTRFSSVCPFPLFKHHVPRAPRHQLLLFSISSFLSSKFRVYFLIRSVKDELEKSTDFYHLPPGWCLIKYVPYLPIELFLAFSLVVCSQLLHGEITKELKEKGEEFYAVPTPGDRPLKMVLKGLPSNTDINDIKNDLANQGMPAMKIAQLTQRKSKCPLPLFLVEVRKDVPDSRDIRDISTFCYMSITWDSLRRRPGPSQCYNCNYFHHSSLNCEIKARCLKCGQEHWTSDCPIKEKI